MRFLVIMFAISFTGSFAFAQDFQGLINEPIFPTSFETEILNSGTIKQTGISGSHFFERFKNSRIGVSARSYELANERKEIPNYYNVQMGLSYKHYLEHDRTLGFFGSYGTASDERFKDSRDSTISFNVAYRYNEKWTWILNYSNNRAFLNNIPLPGFIYVKEQSKERSFIIGFPFFIFTRPFWEDQFSVRYIGLLPYTHRLRIVYNGIPSFKPYIFWEQGPQIFFDSSRTDDEERTFWFERRAGLGIEKGFGPVLKLDLQAGRSYDREYFLGETFGGQHDNVLPLEDETYLSFNIKSSF